MVHQVTEFDYPTASNIYSALQILNQGKLKRFIWDSNRWLYYESKQLVINCIIVVLNIYTS